MAGEVEDVVRAYFDHVAEADGQAFVALFAEGAQVYDPVGAPALLGPVGMAKFHSRLQRAWQSLTMTPVDTFVRGREAAVRWTASGTSASGNAIAFDGINVFTIGDDGQIARLAAFWDFEGVIAQF